MTQLFNRAWRLVIGAADGTQSVSSKGVAPLAGKGLDVSNLDIEFTVRKSLKKEPNTADIRVYNLSEASRRLLEEPKKLVVLLEAGYNSETSQIFLGEVRSAFSYSQGADIITEVSTGDGEKAIRNSRINLSFGPKTPPDVALRAMVRALGVGEGNVSKAVTSLRQRGLASLYGKGAVISGSAWREMQDFANSAGLEVSIQDGKLQFLDKGKALEGRALEISSDTGLVESPTRDNDGVLNFTTLMIPDLRPGVQVAMNSMTVKGGYRVTHCEYVGSTAGNDWYIRCAAKKY